MAKGRGKGKGAAAGVLYLLKARRGELDRGDCVMILGEYILFYLTDLKIGFDSKSDKAGG